MIRSRTGPTSGDRAPRPSYRAAVDLYPSEDPGSSAGHGGDGGDGGDGLPSGERRIDREAGTVALAYSLRLPADRLVDALGGRWRPVDSAADERWWLAGDPPLLMLVHRPDEPTVLLAVPWCESGPVGRYVPADPVPVPLEGALREAAAVANGIVRRRRQSFRFCRYCRRPTAPEHLHDEHSCAACARRWSVTDGGSATSSSAHGGPSLGSPPAAASPPSAASAGLRIVVGGP